MSPATEPDDWVADRIASLEQTVSALSRQNDQMAEDLVRARGLKDVAAIRVSYPLIR
jgi:hypothetical protein